MFTCGVHGFKFQGQFMTDCEWDNLINACRDSEKTKALVNNYQMQLQIEAESRMEREKDPITKEMMRRHIEKGDYKLYEIFGKDDEDLKDLRS